MGACTAPWLRAFSSLPVVQMLPGLNVFLIVTKDWPSLDKRNSCSHSWPLPGSSKEEASLEKRSLIAQGCEAPSPSENGSLPADLVKNRRKHFNCEQVECNFCLYNQRSQGEASPTKPHLHPCRKQWSVALSPAPSSGIARHRVTTHFQPDPLLCPYPSQKATGKAEKKGIN